MSVFRATADCRYRGPFLLLGFLTIMGLVLLLGGRPAAAASRVPVKSIAQITVDDDNRPLSYPSVVFYDPVEEEIYIINGGSGRVLVYSPDFFPTVSIGRGRGVMAPSGGQVLSNGDVYISQVPTYKNPKASITILNGAFFVKREIFFDQIPEAADFSPRQLAVSREGLLYITGNLNRGVLVLDNEGNFLRRLQPQDEVSAFALAKFPGSISPDEGKDAGNREASAESEGATAEEDEAFAQIPEEFRPRASRSKGIPGSGKVQGPPLINYVTISGSGNLYLLSAETGKAYVYGPDEKFLFSFGTKGGSPGQMSQPRSLAVDEEHDLIYIADFMRHTILVYNLAGDFLFEIGGRGADPGWFNFPNGVALNRHGHLIVADLFNKRVQVLEVGYEEYLPILQGWSLGDESDANFGEDDVPIAEKVDGFVEEEFQVEEILEDPDLPEVQESLPLNSPLESNSFEVR